jgi:hypothetical protein
MIEPLIQAL